MDSRAWRGHWVSNYVKTYLIENNRFKTKWMKIGIFIHFPGSRTWQGLIREREREREWVRLLEIGFLCTVLRSKVGVFYQSNIIFGKITLATTATTPSSIFFEAFSFFFFFVEKTSHCETNNSFLFLV